MTKWHGALVIVRSRKCCEVQLFLENSGVDIFPSLYYLAGCLGCLMMTLISISKNMRGLCLEPDGVMCSCSFVICLLFCSSDLAVF